MSKVSHTSSRPLLFFCLQQSAGDAPTTPKYTKEHRDIFFPASLPTPVLLSHAACHPLSAQDGQAKVVYEPLSKPSRPQASGFHDQPLHRRAASHPAAAMAFLPHTGTVASSQHESTTFWCWQLFRLLWSAAAAEVKLCQFSFWTSWSALIHVDQQGAPVGFHWWVT